jgi:ABC-2 type transport system permease protein
MNASSSTFAPPRVPPNAAHAFGGIWRLTIRRFYSLSYWLTMAGMLALLVVFSFPAVSNRSGSGSGTSLVGMDSNGFLPWAGAFYLCFLVPIMVFLSAGGVMRDDLSPSSIDYILNRPVRRPAFIVFRFISHVACAQLNYLLALAVVVGIGAYRNVPGLWNAVPMLLLAQVAVVIAFSAFGFLTAMLTSRYVIVGLVYGAIVEAAVGNTPTQLNRISMLRQAFSIVEPALGGFHLGMRGPLAAEPLSPAAATALLLTMSVGMIAITATLFSVKEFTGAGREL